MRSRRWDDLATSQKVLITALASAQISLAVSACADLAQRPAEQINGTKRTLAAIIALNFIGPVCLTIESSNTAAPGLDTEMEPA